MAWNLKVEEGIGVLELDLPDTEVNVLTTPVLSGLDGVLSDLKTKTDLQALLITSAKKRIFIAGADIKEIRGITTESDAFEKAEQGKRIFQKIEDLPFITISVINGACLGGGYELSLACKYRVAGFSENVKIGLPEVNLGILPGFGGSIRLPRLLGLLKALPLILAGKVVGAKDALKNGMVDRLFPDQVLVENAKVYAREILNKTVKTKKKKANAMVWFLQETTFGRSIVFDKARKGVLKKTKGVYPAPLEIIELLEKTYTDPSPNAYQLESEHFARLGATDISKNLIKLFFLSEQYKKRQWASTEVVPKKVNKCGVVGAGVMGGGIAQRVSYKNIPVRVKDINEEALAGALQEASKIYSGALKRRRLRKHEVDYKMGLISVGLNHDGFKRCDLVVEAVVENMEVKKKVFKELDEVVGSEVILASNTSSLSVSEMASACQKPERVVGLHFFNPVDRMPLVEVIRGKQTSDEVLESTIHFARKLGKTVIVTEDKPGFLVNRLLLPYLNEAAFLLQEGMPASVIDKIATDFGMPMGPIELVDQVGIDVGYKVAHILEEGFGERMKVATILEKVYAEKLLGKKGGKGFYLYKGKKKKEANPLVQTFVKSNQGASSASAEDALKRMIYIMINEAARCLEEKVIDSAGTVDVGMIFGTGFPPFRGGLLRYADEIGAEAICGDLKRFQKQYQSSRFEPSALLQKLADQKQAFYS